jgi:hypothetical protein
VRRAVYPVPPWEPLPSLRAVGCRSALIRDVHRRAAAEICLEGHPVAEGRPVAVVRRDEPVPVQALLLDAFLAARRGDSDTRRKAGRVERGIAGPVAVLRSDAALPELRARLPRDLLLPDAVPPAPPVAEVLPLEQRPAERARSDALDEQRPDEKLAARLPVSPKTPLKDAAERRAPDPWRALPLVALARRERREPHAEALELEPRLVSQPLPEQAPRREPGAQFSLSPRQFLPPPPQPQPPRDPENVFAPAPRVRYRSSSSASSFPGRRSSAKSRLGLWP